MALAIEAGIEEPMVAAHDKIRHCKRLLARWTGGKARLLALTLSHSSLTIRPESLERKGNLHIICLGPERIHAPVQWTDADINISLTEKGTYLVSDQKKTLPSGPRELRSKRTANPFLRWGKIEASGIRDGYWQAVKKLYSISREANLTLHPQVTRTERTGMGE